MTDVRDREPIIEIESQPPRTLVSRALAPVRRVAAYGLTTNTFRQIIIGPDDATAIDGDVRPKSYGRIILLSFILIVVAPTFISGVYFLLWASDQYVSEARFAVRQADPLSGEQTSETQGGTKDSGSSVLGSSINLDNQNAEIIANYIKSHAIIDDIAPKLDIRAIFLRPEADLFARLSGKATNESLVKYWNRMVSVYIESSSGIVTVSVSTFRREDSFKLMQAIVAASEALANSLSVKMRADQEQLAENEVRRAEGSVRFALANLQSFRNSEHLINPVDSASNNGKLLLQLMGAKIQAESDLYVAERAQGPNAPGMTSLRAKLTTISDQIRDLQDQMAGDKEATKNMAATLSVFEQLELKTDFAKKEFTYAQKNLESSRQISMRQTIYLAVFVAPTLPQDYTFPNRTTDVFLTFLIAMMLWICGITTSASILDHRL